MKIRLFIVGRHEHFNVYDGFVMFFLDVLGMFSGYHLDDSARFSGCFGECFLDVFGISLDVLGCFLNVFWRHFANQATPLNHRWRL